MKLLKEDFPLRAFRSILVLALAFICITTFSSCQTEKNEEQEKSVDHSEFHRGADTTVEGRIARLTNQIKFAKDNFELYYERSLLWYEAGNTQRAIEDMDRSIDLNIKNPEAYYMRGFYHYVQNDDEAALKDFKRSINVGTDNSEVFFHIGQIHYFRKEYDLALDAYSEAIRLDSINPGYYFAVGFLEQDRGDFDAAIQQYNEALQRNPAFIKALAALHDLYRDEKGNELAAKSYNDRILQIDSTHPIGHFNQGDFYYRQANKISDENRIDDFETMVKLAISQYSRAIQYDPNFGAAYYNRGYSYYLVGQFDRAQSDFSTVIQLDPYNDRAYFMKGSMLEAAGEVKGALSNYQQAAKLNPDFKEAAAAVQELTAKMEAVDKESPAGVDG